MELKDAIKERYSVRNFMEQEVGCAILMWQDANIF
jgi:hypothetical protein